MSDEELDDALPVAGGAEAGRWARSGTIGNPVPGVGAVATHPCAGKHSSDGSFRERVAGIQRYKPAE